MKLFRQELLLFLAFIAIEGLALGDCVPVPENYEVWKAQIESCEILTPERILSSKYFVALDDDPQQLAEKTVKESGAVLIKLRPLQTRTYRVSYTPKEHRLVWTGEWEHGNKVIKEFLMLDNPKICDRLKKNAVQKFVTSSSCCDIDPPRGAACILRLLTAEIFRGAN